MTTTDEGVSGRVVHVGSAQSLAEIIAGDTSTDPTIQKVEILGTDGASQTVFGAV